MRKLTLSISSLIALAGFIAFFSTATAEEGVCDNESGAAYGLCNAYCDAMDCDSDSPMASEVACACVAERYEKITGNELPCESATCGMCVGDIECGVGEICTAETECLRWCVCPFCGVCAGFCVPSNN